MYKIFPGIRAYFKPKEFLRVIGETQDGRLLVYVNNLGGRSYLVKPEEIHLVPTHLTESEAKEYEKRALTDSRLVNNK